MSRVRAKIGVGRLMACVAVLALTIPMVFSLPNLLVYALGGPYLIDRPGYLLRGMGALVLIVAGGFMAVIVTLIRARYGLDPSARPRLANKLASVCSPGARIVFWILLVSVIAYVIFIVLVLSGDD